MTLEIQDAKEYHLKRLLELSLKSIGEIPQLDDPDEEQQGWIKRKMHEEIMKLDF